MGEKSMLDIAREYVNKKGFSVIPLRPRDKRPVSPWEEYQKRRPTDDELVKWFGNGSNNIGIVAGKISNLSIIDLDGEEAVDFMTSGGRSLPITPMVKTGKDYGYHVYCHFEEQIRNFQARADLPHIDMRSEGGYVVAPPSTHPNGKKYEWFHADEPLAPLPAWFLSLINSSLKGSLKTYLNTSINNSNKCAIFSHGRRDQDLFHVANKMAKGGLEPEFIQKVLELLVNSWGEDDPKWCSDKVKSALKNLEKIDRNVTQDLRDYIGITFGPFSVTNASQGITYHNKASIRTILHRFSKEGIIEPDKSRGDGWFRRVENDMPELDFKNAKGDFLDIKWPFGIEKFVKTAPKNIIIVAGEPDAGKTAFLLNFAALNNWNSMGVSYFSSEMGEFELRTRLQNFQKPTIDGWRMKVFERASNFADVIRPDGINIIDFLELHDEFYKVGLYIREIFDKLKTGIAVIAIQKNPGKEQGLGGMRSIEKARLAINMERGGKAVIEKAKNWATMNNPRGLYVNYKLVQGCKFREPIEGGGEINWENWRYLDDTRKLKFEEQHWQNQY